MGEWDLKPISAHHLSQLISLYSAITFFNTARDRAERQTWPWLPPAQKHGCGPEKGCPRGIKFTCSSWITWAIIIIPVHSLERALLLVAFHSFTPFKKAGFLLLPTEMLFQSPSLLALSAITFFSHASASVVGHARLHHPVQARHAKVSHQDTTQRAANARRQALGMIEVPLNQVQLLQQETAAFRGWMQAWLSTTNPADTPASIMELRQEYEAYDLWLSAWFNSTVVKNGPAPPALPTTVSISAPIASGSSLPTSISPVSTPLSTSDLSTDAPASLKAPPFPSSGPAGPSDSPPSLGPSVSSHSSPPGPTTTEGGVFVAKSDFGGPLPATVPTSTTSVHPNVASSTLVPVAKPSTAPNVNPITPSGGGFNPNAKNNVAVYYGASPATSSTTLGALCKDTNVNIVVLAFLTVYDGPGGYPTIDFGGACPQSQTPEMTAAGATGLLSCPALAKDITTCQGMGKKVLLSFGGASAATTAFTSDTDATKFASTVWNLFGAGTGAKAGLRPFGTSVVDGFDIGKSNP